MFNPEEEFAEEKKNDLRDIILKNKVKIKTISVLDKKINKMPYKTNIINISFKL